MTILRSREIPPAQPKPRRKRSDIQPSTPARTQEPNFHRSPVEPGGSVPGDGAAYTSRRRSLRLAYQCDGDGFLNGSTQKEVSVSVCGKRKSSVDNGLRSGKKVAMRVVDSDGLKTEPRKLDFESVLDVNLSSISDSGNNGNFKLQAQINIDDSKERESASEGKANRAYGDLVEEYSVSKKLENSGASGTCGDYAVVNGDVKDGSQSSITGDTAKIIANENKDKGKGVVEDPYEENENYEKPSRSSVAGRKYTWEEKGKGIQVQNASSPTNDEMAEVGVEEMEIENSVNNDKPPDVFVAELSVGVNAEQAHNHKSKGTGSAPRTGHFRDIAKRNASKFAHFDAQMEEDLSDKEVEQEVEDWPGPFSTAMKIIKDREDNVAVDIGTNASNEERSSTIIWAPKRNYSFCPPRAPSLQELSLRILVKNVDAITSLDYIPDALRVKLCELLCDSRRIDVHFVDLLVRGSPTEIRVPDCSWLTEEQFYECFKNCDTSNLTVLQLDQCGQCMPDYILHLTLAKSPNNLPMLSSLSLGGAYRLSDVGLRALVSAAPAIRSINLSQCSLLTSSSIDMLSDSLGSDLRELYINECQNIDLKLILPALRKFEKLEVLSLADLPSVRGQFLRDFVTGRGQTMKQLILTNSAKLTDSCVKAISENCPNLSVLDLANVCKLTDSALGYLANGCQFLKKLIFCCNSFSDEAVAAFIETAGSSLEELSLNSLKRVGNNTALALGKHSKKLQILDVSWCRDLSNDSVGYIVDNCLFLSVLKLFGCTQITDVLVRGHSNPNVKILGLKMDPFLDHLQKSLSNS